MKTDRTVFLLTVILIAACSSSQAALERMKYNHPGLVVDLGVGLWAWPLPMDYDSDGDYDLLVCCPDKPYNGTYFFENTAGDVTMPVFEPAVKVGAGHRNIRPSYVDGRSNQGRVGPKGGYRRLELAGTVRRLSDAAGVARARTEPPDDTRAWARGQAIKWAQTHALSGGAAWHRVRLGKFSWRWFTDPLDPQR